MLKSTEQIIESPLRDHLIKDSDLAHLFKGSQARRYGLVNKALKKGELIKICRGFYVLADKYRQKPLSQYYLANRIVPNSFITAETALSFHHWIPERVTQVTSLTAEGRSREFDTPFGVFAYHKAPICPEQFYTEVNVYNENNEYIYIAKPLRALIDYLYWHKIKNANLNYLTRSLRIEIEQINKITKNDTLNLRDVYKFTYIQQFLDSLLKGKQYG